MKLYIAEKPSLARTIAKSLGADRKKKGFIEGDGCIITWCFGHLYEMKMPDDYDMRFKKWNIDDLPIIPNEFELKPRLDAVSQINIINSLIKNLKNNDVIVNCGDPDREGQLLVDQVIEASGFNGIVMRAWLKDLTAKGIEKTLSNLKNNKDFEVIKNSALARSQADWIVGLNMTRAYTCRASKYGHQGILTLGRVQTPTLNMVAQRDEQIENFNVRKYYKYEATLLSEGIEFVANQECEKQFNKSVAEQSFPGAMAIVSSYEAKDRNKYPALPFSLAQLQSACNKAFGLSAQETLDVAQKLYETHKLISYPRTDCSYLNEGDYDEKVEMWKSLLDEFNAEEFAISEVPKCFNNKKVGAHTGIIPVSLESKSLSENEQNVFDLIKKNFVCQFLMPMKFNEVVVFFDSDGMKLKSSGKQLIDKGFMNITDNDKVLFEGSILPPLLSEGDQIEIKSFKLVSKKTTPPKAYTEGTLVEAMENIANHLDKGDKKTLLREVGGIGTDATRAGIIDGLKQRGFLEVVKKRIHATVKGRKFVTLIADDIKSPILTAKWESKLKKIEQGELSVIKYLKSLYVWIEKSCADARNVDMSIIGGVKCPSCHIGYIVKKTGKHDSFEGCTNYPDCKYIVQTKTKRRTKKRKKARRAV